VRFVSGREILLQRLPCGLKVEVLSLGGSEEKSGSGNRQASESGLVEATADNGGGFVTVAR
jgi:hypothetical protein